MSKKPRVNNAVKNQARAYQQAHPDLTYAAARAVVNRCADTPNPWAGIIGQTAAKRQLRAIAASNPNPMSAVVLGPVGCGKSYVAETLHTALRGDTPLVPVGAASLSG